MGDSEAVRDFPDEDQRLAFCVSQWDNSKALPNESEEEFMQRCLKDNDKVTCRNSWRLEKAKEHYWKTIDNRRRGFIKFAEREARKSLKKVIDSFMPKIETANDISGIRSRIRTGVQTVLMRENFTNIWIRVGTSFALDTFNNLKRASDNWEKKKGEDEENLRPSFIEKMKSELGKQWEKKLPGISRANERQIRKVLKKGADEGWDIGKIKSEIEKSWAESTPARAQRIARTETIAASNKGAIEGAKATGLNVKKVWISTRDGRTRGGGDDPFDHVRADFHPPIDQGKSFTVSGESLEYPGDSSNASPGNIINCRCSVAFKEV